MNTFKSNAEAILHVFKELPKGMRLAIPLGVGKPNKFVNDFYSTCKGRSDYRVQLYTGLSLDTPAYKTSIERHLVQPAFDQLLGSDYPYLEYVRDQRTRSVPSNFHIYEFYMQPGSQLSQEQSQQDYTSVNYTHVIPQLVDLGVECVFQAIARGQDGSLSLGTNPDLTVDLRARYKESGRRLFLVGVINSRMPYTLGDSVVESSFFDIIVDSPENNHEIFALPHQPIDNTDLMVGLNASQLCVDDGTLQIGIGSLTESLAASLIFRQKANGEYKEAVKRLHVSPILKSVDVFERGLFGTSELITDGFMHLSRAGIVKRPVKVKRLNRVLSMEGAFLLGSAEFYDWVRDIGSNALRSGESAMAMTSVNHINDLYEEDEAELRRERKNARFFNTCMGVSLLGEAFSETLPDGRVISGVGGQYNFVSMAHELRDARSILMFRSRRLEKGEWKSNVNFSGAFATIPRHLRDIFVNEYGVADTRYISDSKVIEALLEITDVEFQDALIVRAQKSGKLAQSYRPTERMKMNSVVWVDHAIESLKSAGHLSEYPFGTEFLPIQQKLIRALSDFKGLNRISVISALLKSLWAGVGFSASAYQNELKFLKLDSAVGFKGALGRQVVKAALVRADGALRTKFR